MKASKILLRWYKSFNVNYRQHADRQQGVVRRPWNSLHVEGGSETDYEFVEIPLEQDVTTIVGANESGKSHLICAISKVIDGVGIPEEGRSAREFDRTDLCHFASVRNKNADAWPNIGMEFGELSDDEFSAVNKAVDQSLDFGERRQFTLIIAPKDKENHAYLYPGNQQGTVALNKAKLAALREVLPDVKFIKSDVAISDDVPVSDLLAAMGCAGEAVKQYFTFLAAQAAAEFLSSFAATPNRQLSAEDAEEIGKIQAALSNNFPKSPNATLEAQLFGDVLDINSGTVSFLAGLDDTARSYAEGLIDIWNDEIEKTLNLSHYWQQDDLFRLRLNYKRGIIYFEITDKTGAAYTFRERSSGLRYFLSYYIQAKALETATRDSNCIILMDEPDSFLSIIGQRNLLAVFESLVSADTSRQNTQLIYTTHSPFLINRNFPRRIRLVQKEDAEEETQNVEESQMRRYDPCPSRLGIDCSQTLFMGATNIVLEGPTDQYLISELVRAFAEPHNVSDFLDLNSVTLVSADSAPGVPKLLAASRWGDERNPATVAVFDSDEEGDRQRKIVTERVNETTTESKIEQKRKQLLDPQFVAAIGELIGEMVDGQKIVTTEDVLPAPLYASAVKSYLSNWHEETYEKQKEKIDVELDSGSFGANGVVADTKAMTEKLIHPDRGGYDKMGVLQEAVRIVQNLRESDAKDGSLESLSTRLRTFCEKLRRIIELSEQAERRETGKQAVVRVVREFFIRHKESSSVFDVELLLIRLEREAELLGEDGAALSDSLRRLLEEVRKLRASEQQRLTDDEWKRWHGWIMEIRKNPLEVVVDISGKDKSESETKEKPESKGETDSSTKRIDEAHEPGESGAKAEKKPKKRKTLPTWSEFFREWGELAGFDVLFECAGQRLQGFVAAEF